MEEYSKVMCTPMCLVCYSTLHLMHVLVRIMPSLCPESSRMRCTCAASSLSSAVATVMPRAQAQGHVESGARLGEEHLKHPDREAANVQVSSRSLTGMG